MTRVDSLAGSFHWMHVASYFERWGQGKWLRVPVIGAGLSDVGGLIAQVDWPHVWPAVGLAITAIGTAVIGLWRYYKLTQIEILIRQREADGWIPPKGISVDTATIPEIKPNEAKP